jgi:membrane protease YdiL (CAAX protease family)
MKKDTRGLLLFLLITFTFSWLFWIPKALVAQGIIESSGIVRFLEFLNLGAYGPFVGAFSATYIHNGRKGMKVLARRAINVSFGRKWFIPILFLMPLIAGSALLIASLLGASVPRPELLFAPHLIIYWFAYMLLLGGPLQEEFGWRGYALDKLQSKYSALTASLFLGFIWACWHMPLNFTEGVGDQYSLVISTAVGSVISLMLMSILFTWIYNNTGKSILSVMLFHASMNFSTFKLFPVFESPEALPFYTILIFITVILVVIVWGRKKLNRADL